MNFQYTRNILTIFGAVWLAGNGTAYAQTTEEARKLVQWLESQPCPKISQPLQIKSLLDDEKRAAVKQKNLQLAKEGSTQIANAIAQRNQELTTITSRGDVPSKRLQRQIDQMDDAISKKTAQVSMALVQWSQAAWIDLAYLNPLYPPESAKPHPLSSFVQDGKTLASIASQYQSVAGASELVSPIQKKYATCLTAMQNTVIDYNSIAISDYTKTAATPNQLQSLLNKYAVAGGNFSTQGNQSAPIVSEVKERIAFLNDIEAQKREAERKERERLARIEAEKRAAEQKARCDAGKKAGEKNLILAKTFVRGITNKNINTAGSVMHSDIVINAPSQSGGRNVSRGISRAKQRLQEGFNDNSGGSTKTPHMSGCGSISARMFTSRGSATMRFEFKGGKISEVYIQN